MTDPEIAVVGGGPAGLSAAIAAAEAGARVLLIEENAVLGGQYYARPLDPESAKNTRLQIDQRGIDRHLTKLREFRIASATETLVWGIFEDRKLACCELVNERNFIIQPKAVVLATGAFQRVIPFKGWTNPRVITAGGVQNLLKSQGILPGRRIIVAGCGPFLMVVASQLVRAGAKVVAVIEAASRSTVTRFGLNLLRFPERLPEALDYFVTLGRAGVPLLYGRYVTEVRSTAEGLEVAMATVAGPNRKSAPVVLHADALCIGHGFVPSSELARLFGCRMHFDQSIGSFVPERDSNLQSTIPGVFIAGEAAGTGGFFTAEAEGTLAGISAASAVGRADVPHARKAWMQRRQRRFRKFAQLLNRSYQLSPLLYDALTPDTVICRCEEVMLKHVAEAVCAGDVDVNAIKSRTRAGMGPCQGRMCEQNLRFLAARESGRAPDQVGAFTARPPVKPLPLGSLAQFTS